MIRKIKIFIRWLRVKRKFKLFYDWLSINLHTTALYVMYIHYEKIDYYLPIVKFFNVFYIFLKKRFQYLSFLICNFSIKFLYVMFHTLKFLKVVLILILNYIFKHFYMFVYFPYNYIQEIIEKASHIKVKYTYMNYFVVLCLILLKHFIPLLVRPDNAPIYILSAFKEDLDLCVDVNRFQKLYMTPFIFNTSWFFLLDTHPVLNYHAYYIVIAGVHLVMTAEMFTYSHCMTQPEDLLHRWYYVRGYIWPNLVPNFYLSHLTNFVF